MPTSLNSVTPIYSSQEEINRQADQSLITGIASQFPIENNKYRITVSDLRAYKKDYTLEDQKNAILQSRSLTYPIKGNLHLTDKATGKVVDTEKDFTLMDSFYLTGKHTLIYSGNNYTISNHPL